MGLFKEIVKGFAEGYVSERGIDGTLEDLSNLGSKLFGSNNSNNYISPNNFNEEWNKTYNEIVFKLDNENFPQAYDLLNSFYESYSLNKDFVYYQITYWTMIRWLESGKTEGYDENILISWAENSIVGASELSCDSDSKKDIREADSRLQKIIKFKQETDEWNIMQENFEKYLQEKMFGKAHDVLEKFYKKYEKDYFYYRDKLKVYTLKLSSDKNTIIDPNTESKIEDLIKIGLEKSFDENSKSFIEGQKQSIFYDILRLKIDYLTKNGEYDEASNLVEMYNVKGLSTYDYRSLKRLVIQRKWRATPATDPSCIELEKQVLASFDIWQRVCTTDKEKESVVICFNEVYSVIKAEKEEELKRVKSSYINHISDYENEYLLEYNECMSEDGQISEKERRLLDRLASSLGISQERLQEIELQCAVLLLSTEEKEYLEEYRACINEDGSISDKERRLLDKLAKTLGLTQETVNRLELSIKQ